MCDGGDGREIVGHKHLAKSIVAGYQFPVPGSFEPCGVYDFVAGSQCEDTSRYIEIVPSNDGKKLVCGNDHNHMHRGKWFIPAYEFESNGDFSNVLPDEYRPMEGELRKKRWTVSSETQDRLRPCKDCACCYVPQFISWENSDSAELLEWITQYDKDLKEVVQTELGAKAGMDLRDWYFEVSPTLRKRILKRINQSKLVFDHGVPKRIGNVLWSTLSRDARTLLQGPLVFPISKHCNLKRGARPLPEKQLVELYASYNYDSMAHAVADGRRWAALQEILEAVYRKAAG